MKRGWTLAVAALIGAAWTGSALADMVVVRVAGEGLRIGQTVASGASVTLPDGASAILLSQDGRTVSLTGPYSGAPDAGGAPTGGDPRTVTALSRLLTAGATDTAALGVTRGTQVRDAFAIDLNGGAHCQVADKPPLFKRAKAPGQARLTVTSALGAESDVVWTDGATDAAWPETMPLIDGTYLLRTDAKPAPVKLMVRQVPSPVQGPAAVAAWMADHGCAAQALALLATLR